MSRDHHHHHDGRHDDEAVVDADGAERERVEIAAIRERLAAGGEGRRFWRSLEDVAETPEFAEFLHHEFPRQAVPIAEGVDRRQFLRLMSASLALAGLGACTRQPPQNIVPYAKAPEEGIVPGEPLFFATAMPLGRGALGLLVESHMGRPTKVEGNPQHPLSLGATDLFAQASVLGLYDPDRSQVITSAGEIRPWSAFLEALRAAMEKQRAKGGAGVRLLTETVTSPTLAQQIHDLLAELPGARWCQYEPLGRDRAIGGGDAHHRFERADVVLALDADFLACGPAAVRDARALSSRRRPDGAGEMNRLYVVEPMPTITGAAADHRLALRAGDVERLARAIAAALGVRGVAAPAGLEAHAAWVAAVARDLAAHAGTSLVVAGDTQPPAVHALARAMNQTLENVGRTVLYGEPATPAGPSVSLRDLVDDMETGHVELLLIVEGNPVVTAPADLRFAERLEKVGLRVRLGLYDDETSRLCHWHVPAAHYLESWSDARAYDGTATIIQPLIAPLYEGKTAHELIAACTSAGVRAPYDLVRDYWKRQPFSGDFEAFWRRALHDGVVPGTAGLVRAAAAEAELPAATEAAAGDGALEIAFRSDPTLYDGRFANNGWLQELPKPMTRLTWDNAACIAPATAERLGLANEDLVELHLGEAAVRAPIWIVPGHAADAVTVHLGYGRTRAGRVANGAGFDAYVLRTSDAMWAARGLEIHKTGERYPLASTQNHQTMDGRALVRAATIEEYRADPAVIREHAPEEPPADLTMYPPQRNDGYAWGMTIDLSTCTGCNACVIACQSENNIAVVGKDQVGRGREMHWIRVDRYFEGGLDEPAIHHQPVPCMQCELAPCEVVCPVEATVHSNEGLNQMIYNRCVGTKYCSNNCPYKVRRFNFYLYSDWTTESLKMQRNPDVTVRSRGVMEKCTFCVQRIQYAKITSEKEDRRVRDGEIVPACAQACPAQAIVFGDQNDADSKVAKLKAEPRNYALLGEINTRPRTTYLAKLRNPNPELERA